jgi:cytoskeletal protein CcmA (bactofilin family)
MDPVAYNDPAKDIEINSPYRGNIRCRKLVVKQSGSIIGNIEAVDVRNDGRIHGIVNCTETYINNASGVIRGCVYAPNLGVHPKSGFEATASKTTPFSVEHTPVVAPSVINLAIEEGIRRELAKRPAIRQEAVSNQTKSAVEGTKGSEPTNGFDLVEELLVEFEGSLDAKVVADSSTSTVGIEETVLKAEDIRVSTESLHAPKPIWTEKIDQPRSALVRSALPPLFTNIR